MQGLCWAVAFLKYMEGGQVGLLYKYYQFEGSRYWEPVISKGELYFSSYDQFNDPFELHFKTSTEGDFGTRHRILIKHNPNNERIKSFNSQEDIDSYVGWLNESTSSLSGHRERMKSIGISCFSESHDEVLMWAHYSKGLSGICFEFEQKLLEDKSSPPSIEFVKVQYLESLPTINFFNDRNGFLDKVSAKSRSWSYEREVRAYKVGLGRSKFDAKALTKIIVGANALKGDKSLWELPYFDNLKYLISEFRPDLKHKIYIAKPKDDEYRLSIEPFELFP
jgi:hypothetical protein